MPNRIDDKPFTVSVVDDDAALNRSLCALLRDAGYTVLSFPSAEGFLAHLPSLWESVDLVISDISMPGPSGYDLCRTVREKCPVGHLPVILITGVNGGPEKTKGLELGADDFIQKPFRGEEILAKAKSLLHLRAQERRTLSELSSTKEANAGLERLRHFFSPRVADLLTSASPQALLQRHRAEVTVLFVDLRGFTGFAETAEPEEVLSVLENYYSAVGSVCLGHGGTLAQMAGDGVMVFFNDPEPVPEHKKVAINAAIAIRHALRKQKQEWRARGYEIDFGMGLAEGYATIGGIGFENFWQYTVIGTVTNLASRLCQAAGGEQILISHRMLALSGSEFHCEPVGNLEVKGLHKPVAIVNVTQDSPGRSARESTP